MKPLPSDLGALRAGGKAALARALSALETAPDDPDLVALLDAAFAAPGGPVSPIAAPFGAAQAASRSRARAGSSGRVSSAVRLRASAPLPPAARVSTSLGRAVMRRRPSAAGGGVYSPGKVSGEMRARMQA